MNCLDDPVLSCFLIIYMAAAFCEEKLDQVYEWDGSLFIWQLHFVEKSLIKYMNEMLLYFACNFF